METPSRFVILYPLKKNDVVVILLTSRQEHPTVQDAIDTVACR